MTFPTCKLSVKSNGKYCLLRTLSHENRPKYFLLNISFRFSNGPILRTYIRCLQYCSRVNYIHLPSTWVQSIYTILWIITGNMDVKEGLPRFFLISSVNKTLMWTDRNFFLVHFEKLSSHQREQKQFWSYGLSSYRTYRF